MMTSYLVQFGLFFILPVLLSAGFTMLIKIIATKFGFLDYPDSERKFHKKPIPLLGGLAIFLAFWITIVLLYFAGVNFDNFNKTQLFLIFGAGLILMITGILDDIMGLKYKLRLFVSVIAVLLVLSGGVNFDGITNPFGGTIGLDFWKLQTPFGEILVGVFILAFLWLLGMMYTVKILDGLDGLSTGVSAIGALSVAALAGGATKFNQPDVAIVALVLAAACIGFLIFNFYPAKIFLGEGGGQFLGLMIGVLGIIAGSKIATALLVMAVPIVDLFWVIISRLIRGQSVSQGDRRHLHFRLVDSGFRQWQAVLIFYGFSALFGFSALYMSSFAKIISLIFLVILIIILEVYISKKQKYV